MEGAGAGRIVAWAALAAVLLGLGGLGLWAAPQARAWL